VDAHAVVRIAPDELTVVDRVPHFRHRGRLLPVADTAALLRLTVGARAESRSRRAIVLGALAIDLWTNQGLDIARLFCICE
jgi:hypothetical protein